jgi:hypothetical protein
MLRLRVRPAQEGINRRRVHNRHDFPLGHPGPPHVGSERVAQVMEDEPVPLKPAVHDPGFSAGLLERIPHVRERLPLVLENVPVLIGLGYPRRNRLEHREQLGVDRNPVGSWSSVWGASM